MDEYAASIIDADPFLQMVKKSEFQATQERRRAEEEAELDRQEQEQIDAVIAASLEAISACEMPLSPQEAQPEASSSRQQLASTLLDAGVFFTEVNNANMPKISTQMNTHWMRSYQDRSKQPQVIVSAGPRHGQLDTEMVQRFRIIWWEQVSIFAYFTYPFIIDVAYKENVDPAIFPVQGCPEWPSAVLVLLL